MKDRSIIIDYAKTVSMWMIVIIHTQPFLHFSGEGRYFPLIGSIFNSIARLGVPFFFMLFGYLAAKKSKNHIDQLYYIKKFSIRILFLYITWSCFYIIFDHVMEAIKSGSFLFNKPLSGINIISLFYYGKYHLWFLVSLFYSAIALVFFIIGKQKKILLTGAFIFYILGLFGQSYHVFFDISLQTRDTFFFSILFVFLGYYIGSVKNENLIRVKSNYLYAVFFIGLFLQIIETIILYNFFDAKLGNYYIFTPAVSVSIMLYIAVKSQKSTLQENSVSRIGHYTLGIYLIHPALIRILREFEAVSLFISSLGGQLLITPIIFFSSYFLALAYKKIIHLKLFRFDNRSYLKSDSHRK